MSDPGKRVDVHLTTKEWKALRVLADDFGWSLKDAARWAINESVENEADNDTRASVQKKLARRSE